MTVKTEFLAAVNQIAAERNIDPEEIFEAIELAMLTIYKKYYGEGEAVYTELNRETGEIKMIADKKVVAEVTDPKTQIDLKVAKKIESRLKKGDHVEVDITPEVGFGRLAAQVARQVIMQKVREAEKEVLVTKFKEKVGTIQLGTVQRMEGPTVVVDIDKMVVHMSSEEQMPREFYRSGDRKKFYLKEVKDLPTGTQMIVSRGCSEFLTALFEIEVPEISTGTVEIKAVAREGGSRSKVAVWSNQEGIDPIGSCVGQRGVRINAVTDELGGEKIDIILWDEDIATFIANSLSPAEVIKVKIDEKEKIAKVCVPEDQLSLAIGKEGQNVRLAAKLTGWKIDITGPEGALVGSKESDGKSKKRVDKAETTGELDELGLTKRIIKLLVEAGVETIKDLKKLSTDELLEVKGIGKKAVGSIVDALK